MKRGHSRRGLSPVIASVLLVFLVLIIATIVFLWARGFFSEQLEKGGESIESQCMKVKMRAAIAGGFTGNRLVTFEISNDGDIDIYGISIKEKSGGTEVADAHYINLEARDSTTLEVTLNSAGSEEIVIYPLLLGGVVGGDENKEYTCTENAQVIKL